jgi:hypothetical protein
MFNPLSLSEMVTAIGLASRAAARQEGPLDEFDRGQLMSSYSATRHLAIELTCFAPELRRQSEAIAAAADRAARELGNDPDAEALQALADQVQRAPDAPAVGAAVADLLALARRHDAPPWVALRGEVRRCLRALCDREVELLAEGLEAGRR